MTQPKPCKRCGREIPVHAPLGQCPHCLMTIATVLSTGERPASITSQDSGRQFGDFLLGKQLGSGGMGIVYEATQISLSRKVALKFIRDSQVASPMLLRRFTIEAEATARLRHPNIVGIHEIGEHEGQPYYSMDLVEGESLRSAMNRGEFNAGVENESRTNARNRYVAIARLMARTAHALHHAHQRGVLHRDVKPANILLNARREPHLTDFGLAKILRQATEQETRESLTGTGDINGTPVYMSPEQAASSEVTPLSDIYALGAVLYELLTGQPPIRGSTALETLQKVQNVAPRSPRSLRPHIEKDLETICLKCLEKDPRHRYSTAEAFAQDLENWIEHRPIQARPAGPFLRTVQWTQRNRTGTALIAVLGLALVGALGFARVLDHQKRGLELQQGLLFQERAEQLTKEWADTNVLFLTVSSKTLAILDNRTPNDSPSARRLSFAMHIPGDPVTFAQQNAEFFTQMESALGRRLNAPVQLDFIASKNAITTLGNGASGGADVALMEAPDFLNARRAEPRLVPVALKNRTREVVIAVRNGSGLERLEELRGRSIYFYDNDNVMTLVAKAALLDAGLRVADFKEVTHATDDSTRVAGRTIVTSISRGTANAGTVLLRRFNYDKDKPPGLTALTNLITSPSVYAARVQLPAELAKAIGEALVQLEQPITEQREEHDSGHGGSERESIAGAIPHDEAVLARLRDAMRKAARFDGLPDPFPDKAP